MSAAAFDAEEADFRERMRDHAEGARAKNGNGAAGSETPGEKRPLFRPLPPALDFPAAALGPLRDAAEAVQAMTQAPLASAPRASWRPSPWRCRRSAMCGCPAVGGSR
jgi:hypothetical protein